MQLGEGDRLVHPAAKVAPDTYLCGTLLADKYTAAQACVVVA